MFARSVMNASKLGGLPASSHSFQTRLDSAYPHDASVSWCPPPAVLNSPNRNRVSPLVRSADDFHFKLDDLKLRV